MFTHDNPVLVELRRGDCVESQHRGAAVAAHADGRIVRCWGDCTQAVFPRSAVKAIQALPLIETGALAAFGLGSEELALAAASHTGEPMHVERVRAWLTRLGLGPDDLECGAHAPSNPDAAAALIRSGEAPCPLHNNCSGKHAGFLTLARHLGIPTRGYIQPDHPVQELVAAALAEMTGCAGMPWAVDGCGIPTFALPLSGIATAMARLADPTSLAPSRAEAARAVFAAMREHPTLVAGSGRLCSRFMKSIPGIAIKGGAEGVYTAIIPSHGWGVALKIDDGAGRAAEIAILAVLTRLGLIAEAEAEAVANRAVLNVAGKRVGELRAVF